MACKLEAKRLLKIKRTDSLQKIYNKVMKALDRMKIQRYTYKTGARSRSGPVKMDASHCVNLREDDAGFHQQLRGLMSC